MDWTNSKLQLLQACPWAFEQRYILRVPGHPNPALEGGSSAHRALARVVDLVLQDESIDVQAIGREVTAGRPEEYAGTISTLTTFQEALADAEEPIINPKKVIAFEERLAMPLDLPDGCTVEFSGKPDLIEAHGKLAVITDWKTHWRPETQEVFEADPQLPRYALLTHHHHPQFNRFRLVKRFVRYRNSSREREISVEDLDLIRWNLIHEIEEAERTLTDDALLPTPGDWCNLCGFVQTCPVVQQFLEHGIDLAIDSDEKAAEVAATMRAIDAAASEAKRKLKVYLGEGHPTGEVELSGGVYGYGPVQKSEIDAGDVKEIFESFDRSLPWDAFRVVMGELNRALDREPGALKAAVQQAIHTYEQAQCRWRKAKAKATDESEERDAA